MATNQKNQGGREEQDQKGRGSNQGNSRSSQENQDKSRGGSQESQENSGSSNRGFASMDDDKQREIASKGGKAAHESGHAHEFDSKEAKEAGRKGGKA
ncbi:KGG domain-containing protein [Mucilaginibacter sp.]|uniref:KGG domain-containing protein n=1 Tax=Mucilaginibacter sp. TaxID=1882438 RepID=UPI002606FE03|nr:KGG domain-containing protein [Mucilaginibacter sp.]MDB4924020.1 ral stress protein [Mucilaginibacter sp.]